MFSIHGIYEGGKIVLSYRTEKRLPDDTEVLLTFYDETDPEADDETESAGALEKNEAYYQNLREYERVKAYGNITIIVDGDRHTYPLYDYSQGGLSFISKIPYPVDRRISAGIADPANPDLILMELDMEVRGVYELEEFVGYEEGIRYKIGCMFLDPVDEDLWHGLLQYLS